jgi:nitrite reductase/ring-hydroxylating ferredoxin subunit
MAIAVKPIESVDWSRKIDRRIYRDPNIYRAELERIFRRSWIFVGLENELKAAGDFLTTTVGEEPVVVTRDGKGQLRAFYNTCTHRASMLICETHGNCPAFRCLYHGWTFNLEGRLTGVPYPDAYGEQFRKEDFDIPAVHVDSFAGLVFVALEPLVPRLKDFLGEAMAPLEKYCTGTEVLGRVRWRYMGNWKLWHENFADNYHPEFVHRFVGEGYKGVDVTGANYQLDDGHGLMLFPSQRQLPRVQAALSEVLGQDIDFNRNPLYALPPFPVDFGDKHAILTVFPTFDLQYFLGRIGTIIQVLHPEGPDSTIVELLARSVDTQTSAGKISGDDTEALWRVQHGAHARAVETSDMSRGQAPGKVGEKRDEYSLRSFYRGWHMYMDDGQSS